MFSRPLCLCVLRRLNPTEFTESQENSEQPRSLKPPRSQSSELACCLVPAPRANCSAAFHIKECCVIRQLIRTSPKSPRPTPCVCVMPNTRKFEFPRALQPIAYCNVNCIGPFFAAPAFARICRQPPGV